MAVKRTIDPTERLKSVKVFLGIWARKLAMSWEREVELGGAGFLPEVEGPAGSTFTPEGPWPEASSWDPFVAATGAGWLPEA